MMTMAAVLSTFFLVFISITFNNVNCSVFSLAFETIEGDKIVIGEISRISSSSQIQKVLEELEAHHSSYYTKFHDTNDANDASVSYSITKLMKCNQTGINSFRRLFEIEMNHWLEYLQLHLGKLETLSSVVTIFQSSLLITTRKTISNVYKTEFVEPVLFNLLDEIGHEMNHFDEFDDENFMPAEKSNYKIKENFCIIL
jgi:hypothetical protein